MLVLTGLLTRLATLFLKTIVQEDTKTLFVIANDSIYAIPKGCLWGQIASQYICIPIQRFKLFFFGIFLDFINS